MSDFPIRAESHVNVPCVARFDYQVWRRPTTYPLYFLILSALILAASFFLRLPQDGKIYLPFVEGVAVPGLCHSRELLGIPCPGCGLTRCFVSLAHGQLVRAWQFNPAGILLFAFLVFQIPYRVVQLCQIHAGRRPWYLGNMNWFGYLVLAILLAQWTFRVFDGRV